LKEEEEEKNTFVSEKSTKLNLFKIPNTLAHKKSQLQIKEKKKQLS
jgi:hypothetical protein